MLAWVIGCMQRPWTTHWRNKGRAMGNTRSSVSNAQIAHAGEGGIYAELLGDRSFGGLAYSLALSDNRASTLTVPASSFEHEYLPFSPAVQLYAPDPNDNHLSAMQLWRSTAPPEYRCWCPCMLAICEFAAAGDGSGNAQYAADIPTERAVLRGSQEAGYQWARLH